MSLSRICAATLGALALSLASSCFATGEDTPLPGDFQPPAASKNARKQGSNNNGSIAPATPSASNISPKQNTQTELNANSTVKAPAAASIAKLRHTTKRTNNAHSKARPVTSHARLGRQHHKSQSTAKHIRQKQFSIVGKKAAVPKITKNKQTRNTAARNARNLKKQTGKAKTRSLAAPKRKAATASKATHNSKRTKQAHVAHRQRKH